jgi:adhesin/invasin
MATALTILVVPAASGAVPAIAFAPAVYYPTGQAFGTPSADENGTATGDFNGDGKTDVVSVSQWEGNTVVLQYNLGGGAFQTPGTVITISGGSFVENVLVGKFTDSGRDDIVVTGSQSFWFLRNNGSGFTQSAAYSLAQAPFQTSAVATDLNGDGKLDLAIKTPSGVQAELGDGAGAFTAGPASTISGSFAPAVTSIAVANINGDAKPDLFASDAVTQNIFALVNTGTGTFTSSVIGPAPIVPGSVVAIRDTANGLDSAVGLSEFNVGIGSATLFANNGNGTFAAAKTYAGGLAIASGTSGDLNGDGWGDVVSSDTLGGDQVVLAGDGRGGLVEAGAFATGLNSQTPAVADVNGDGKRDIVVTTSCPDGMSRLTNASCLAVLINQG